LEYMADAERSVNAASSGTGTKATCVFVVQLGRDMTRTHDSDMKSAGLFA